MVYYNSVNNHLGDMELSVLCKPVLSVAEIKSWSAKNASILTENNDSCVISYGNVKDTAWIYTIDKKKNVIIGLDLRNNNGVRDTILLNTSYYYNETNGLQQLYKIALRADSSLQHGGYVFSNIMVNENIDDSMFVVPNAVRFGERGSLHSIKIDVRTSGIYLVLPTQGIQGIFEIYDVFGKKVYASALSSQHTGFVWHGKRNFAPGAYVMRIVAQGITVSRGFIWHK